MSQTNLVTGGLGFLGSHLVESLLNNQENVICLDDCSSGSLRNIQDLIKNDNFKFIKHNIIYPIDFKKIDKVWHFACPASPKKYQLNPIETAKINFIGSMNVLEIAKKNDAKIVFESSSE